MFETFQISLLATFISSIIASLLTFFSARPTSIWGQVLKSIFQLVLATVRSIHPLISVIFIIVFTGINPKSGVLALTIYSTAVFTRVFSEYAQEHMSISWSRMFKFVFPGLTIKYLPSNILIASVLGFMGGGGIGFYLQQSINLLDYHNVSTGILACIIFIGGLDLICEFVCQRMQKLRLLESEVLT
jgi:phosphonate transport system permease protein